MQRDDGRFLIPTASDHKPEAGRLFHSAAGHVLSAETYSEAALRELKEETSVTAEKVEFWGAFWFEKEYATRKERERFEVHRALYHPSMGAVRMNDEQIKEEWLSEAELAAIYKSTPERISGPLRMTCRIVFKFDG